MELIPSPTFMYHFAKHSISVNRPWKFNTEQMREYQGKALNKMVKYAYTTLLYQQKYKEIKIEPNKIKMIDDVKKLPFVTKQDLRSHGTLGTLPKNVKRKKLFKVGTSGSTGKPIYIYRDTDAVALESTIISRMLKTYNLNPLKIKMTNIGDFSIQNSYDQECITNGTLKKLGFLSYFSKKNVQHLYAGDKIKKIMDKLVSFNPDFIISYPGTLIGLMELRNEGHGEGIDPKYVVVSGGVLDQYTKHQFENTFNTKVFSLYAATESGTVAFECLNGHYHVQSDLVFIEAIDEKKNHVSSGKHGHLVVTRLYGGGTPIIRYTGMDDIVSLLDYEECDCGMNTQLLKNVEGRASDSIVLPDGRIFPPATFTLIPGEVARDSGVDIVQRFQIIQNKKDDIEILTVINEKLRDEVLSVEKILDDIKRRYQNLVGEDVNVDVKEVKKVKKDVRSPNSLSTIVMSYVDHNEYL